MKRIVPMWWRLRHNRSHALAVGAGITLYILLGGLLWLFLDWYVDPDNATNPSTAKKDLMQAWGFIMAGVAGAVGIYFAWRNLQQGKEELITERFTRAIEQLGSDKLEVRLGGIYALEQIADDSPQRDYHAVMAVLAAYFRENIPRPPEGEKKEPPDPPAEIQVVLSIVHAENAAQEGKAGTQSENEEPPVVEKQAPLKRLPADIQAILDVLSRRKKAGKVDDISLDLTSIALQEAHLSRRSLQKALLFDAKLQEAVCWGTNLQGAYLDSTDLRGASFWGANLKGASLSGADLQKASLYSADLRRASFTDDTKLQGAYLWNTDLRNARGLTQRQIEQAHGDENTKLPNDLKRPAAWKTVAKGRGPLYKPDSPNHYPLVLVLLYTAFPTPTWG